MFSLEDNSSRKSNLLEVKVKNYGECSFCQDDKNKEVLKIPWNIWSQWLYISQYMSAKEWGAVFWVKEDTISDFKIPKQKVNSTECEFEEDIGGDGMIHSHHDMGAFHSNQDDHHARNLYCYSIVISNSKGYEATKRIKLPCGGFGYIKVELRLINLPDIELSKITEKAALDREAAFSLERQKELSFNQDESPCTKCTTHDCGSCKILDTGQLPCDSCTSLKCKECQFTFGGSIDMFPFCSFCEDESCSMCAKLISYLDNYPEERKDFEYLFAGEK